MIRLPFVAIAMAMLATACSGHSSTPTNAATTPAQSGSLTNSTAAITASPTVPVEATPTWLRIADIPTARSEAAVAFSERSGVYVIGGVGGPTRVERYDPSTGLWEGLPDLPIGVVDAAAAAVEGLQNNSPQGMFVFGGYLADGSVTARSFLLTYGATAWQEIAPMPAPRAAGAAVRLGASVFIIGGSDGNGLIAGTYRYDVITQQWRTVAPIPTPRDHLAAAGNGRDRLCAVGGRQPALSLNVATFECYNPNTDAWVRMPDAPTARSGAGAAENDSVIFVVGGEQAGGTSATLEIFDTRTNAWSRGADLPDPRYGLGVVALPGSKQLDPTGKNAVFTSARLLSFGGAPVRGGSPTSVCDALDVALSVPSPPGPPVATPTR